MSQFITRKETFTFTEADYTAGAWSTLKLSSALGKAGNIHRVVLMQSALNAAGAGATGGAMDTRVVNGYYSTSTVGNTVPARDVSFEDLASTMAPSDLVASADINVAGTAFGALYCATQRRQARAGTYIEKEDKEVIGVAIKPASGVDGTITVTVYAYVNS